jgi:hypothetical protein
MSEAIVVLFGFVALGLAGQRLGKLIYLAMGLVILVYVSLAYVLDGFHS